MTKLNHKLKKHDIGLVDSQSGKVLKTQKAVDVSDELSLDADSEPLWLYYTETAECGDPPPTCSASLSPVAYRIEQQQSPHTYWIQRMILGSEGPLWFLLLRLGDPSACLPSLKTGYATPESALRAWQNYANLNWPNRVPDSPDKPRTP